MTERLAIVTGGHGLFGSFEGVGGGGELDRGKTIGAGGTRSIKGALGLVDFLVRRLGAADGEEDHEQGQAASHATHLSRVYVSAFIAAGGTVGTTASDQLP
jgi:hypothetical protein